MHCSRSSRIAEASEVTFRRSQGVEGLGLPGTVAGRAVQGERLPEYRKSLLWLARCGQ